MLLLLGFLNLLAGSSYAELVYENPESVTQKYAAQEDERINERKVVQQPAPQPVVAPTPMPVVPVQVAAPAPVAAPAQAMPQQAAPQIVLQMPSTQTLATQSQATDPNQPLSKSELLRRERVREEVKNEDILQSRIEELRLKDEKKRTEKALGFGNEELPGSAPVTPLAAQPTAPQTVIVGAPIQPSQSDLVRTSLSSTSSVMDAELSEPFKTKLIISPNIGLPSRTGMDGIDAYGKYSMGIGLGLAVDEHLTVELAYSYNEFGARVPIYSYGAFWYDQNRETFTMKQNVFETSIKGYLTDTSSTFRPYLGLGMGYGYGYVNYSSAVLNEMRRYYPNSPYASDYVTNSYFGTLATGFDVAISKAVSIGAGFKYYHTLSSRSRSDYSNNQQNYQSYGGYYQPAQAYYGGYNYGYDQDKARIADSFAKSGFFKVNMGVNIQF